MPIIDVIATDTADPSIETDAQNDVAIAGTKAKKITYNRFNPDGSVTLRSIAGISLKNFKRLSDKELEAIGLYREEIGIDTKYFEIQEDRDSKAKSLML